MNFSFSSRPLQKTTAILAISVSAGVWCVFAQDKEKTAPAPAPIYPVQRYESLWKNSLFGKTGSETASTTSSDWNLAGVFEIDGKKGAILMNEKTGAVENVTLEAPNESGIQLVTVQPGGKGAPPRVEITQNGTSLWVSSRKIQPTGVMETTPTRALVNSRAGTPVPRRDDTASESQAAAEPRQTKPQNLAPPSPLDVPTTDVPLPNDPTGSDR